MAKCISQGYVDGEGESRRILENQMMKIVDESIFFFLWDFSLKILSGSSLHFVGIRVFIVVYVRNVKSQVSSK